MMKTKHVYLVEASSGRYDDYCNWVEGVFSTKAEAQKHRSRVLMAVRTRKASKCPVTGASSTDDSYELLQKMKNLTNEDYKKHHNWWDLKNDAKEFNWCKIIRLELNSDLKYPILNRRSALFD